MVPTACNKCLCCWRRDGDWIWRTAPYLYDGRADTLESLFREHNPDDLHGETSDLSDAELKDLVEYLRSL